MKKFLLTLSLFSFVLVPTFVFAEEAVGVAESENEVFELVETGLEFFNLFFALLIVLLSFKILFKLGGQIKKAWKYMVVASISLGLLELHNALSAIGLFHFEGIQEVFEFLSLLSIFLSTFKVGSIFIKKINL